MPILKATSRATGAASRAEFQACGERHTDGGEGGIRQGLGTCSQPITRA